MRTSIEKSGAWLKISMLLFIILIAFVSIDAHAQIQNANLMDNVLDKYAVAARTWGAVITKHASWLFWTLATISLVWTFGMMALKKADIGEFFAEFIRFTIFTGFFWWLLSNGPSFATDIMDSLRRIGAEASGNAGVGMSPSDIVDIGFDIFNKVLDNSTGWKPLDSAAGIVIAGVILVVLALIAVNMLILLISAWILAYAGVFFLGFGGARWTSEMAIGYFKMVLSVGAQLFAMVLLVGIGKSFIDQYYQSMSQTMNLRELPVMLVASIILLVLVNKVPALIGSLAGAHTHAIGGGFGAGAVLGAAAMGAAAAATAGAALAAGGTSIAGGVQALMAAYSQANAAEAGAGAMSDIASALTGGESEGSGGGTGSSPLASAMGDSDSGGGSLASAANSSVFGESSSGGDSGSASASSSSGEQNSGASAGSDAKGGTNGAPGEVKSGGTLAAAGAAAAKVGRVAAGTATNLAQGTWDVAKAKGGEIKGAALDRIGETTGGKIAAAINARANATPATADQADSFEENSLSNGSSEPIDAEEAEEIAAFVNRDSKSA